MASKIAEEFILNLIDEWHEGDFSTSLYKHMGVEYETYMNWVEGIIDDDDLADLININY